MKQNLTKKCSTWSSLGIVFLHLSENFSVRKSLGTNLVDERPKGITKWVGQAGTLALPWKYCQTRQK